MNAGDDDGTELFELELAGGAIEARYRAMRPEVEALPWGTLAPVAASLPPALREAAQTAWTRAAFQEHRTGAACASTLRALIEARAPVDLVAVASRFPLDEMVHVELCARVAAEYGGAAPLAYDPDALVSELGAGAPALMRAAHRVVAYFCVGEALSIPLLHGTWKACKHPLTRGVLKRIVVDEADHGTFGWAFLDWALPHLGEADRIALGRTADRAIAGVRTNWDSIRARRGDAVDDEGPVGAGPLAADLGWMTTDAYLDLASASLERQVVAPLAARGVPCASALGRSPMVRSNDGG